MSKSAISKVRGILPVFKEFGINCHTYIKWLQLHIAYEFPADKHWYKPHVEYFRALDPYASGVLTIAIGKPSYYLKYLKFCDNRYIIDLKMGRFTITDYYKSPSTDIKPFDHIKLDDVQSACQSFIGTQLQVLPKGYFISSIGIHEDDEGNGQRDGQTTKYSKNFLSLENQMHYVDKSRPQHREVTCHSIKLIKFDPPDLTLEVDCGVTFSLRSFVRDLFTKLDTCGSFINIKRTREGPFTLDQCIDRTDFYLKYLQPALSRYTEPFVDHVRPHLDKTPFYDGDRFGKSR